MKTNVAQSTAGASAGAASGGASCATLNTTSRSTPSTNTRRDAPRRAPLDVEVLPQDGERGAHAQARPPSPGRRRRPPTTSGAAPSCAQAIAAAMQDRDAGRDGRGALDVVGGEDDRVARRAQLDEQRSAARRPPLRVEAAEGLVEEQESGRGAARGRARAAAPCRASRCGPAGARRLPDPPMRAARRSRAGASADARTGARRRRGSRRRSGPDSRSSRAPT